MSFAAQIRGRELAYITRLLSVFGAVEQQQMRKVLGYLSDAEYGRIITRLYREGQIFWARNGELLSASRMAMENTRIENSVACFWAFISYKNLIHDFCPADAPAVATLSIKGRTAELIPVSEDNMDTINESMEHIPKETLRFLVTTDLKRVIGVNRRYSNDYVLLVKPDGSVECYDL